MYHLRFDEAAFTWTHNIDVSVLDSSLRELLLNYELGIQRVASLAALPLEAIDYAIRDYSKYYGAFLTVVPDLDTTQVNQKQAEIDAKFRELCEKEETEPLRRDLGHSILMKFLERAPHQMRHGLAAILASQIIQAWTAFETLATDLWVEGLNLCPPLGVTAMGAQPLAGEKEESAEKKRKIRFPIPLQKLQKYDFNLKTSMGSLLKEKWKFTTRDGIRQAYCDAFGGDAGLVADIIDDKAIKAMSALRNVIVHRSGIADEDFLKDKSGNDCLGPAIRGIQVAIDGEMVSRLCKRTGDLGAELVLAMNKCIRKNR
jgi:hypothetical protein